MSYDPEKVTYIGKVDYRNKGTNFGIKAKDRTRHIYVIGKTGMGKSTFLENMAVQDIQSGEGMAFIDPHGSTAQKLLDYVPEHRVNDVIFFAPYDQDYPISFNVMEDVGKDRRHFVVSGLMSAFKKIWVDAWSARMEYILQNVLFALLEYPDSTLLGVNRMLTDKEYRKRVVDNITDQAVRAFWVDEFAKYTDRFAAEATPAIQNKVGQFTANPLIRNIIGQPKSSFDFRKVMDEGKILIMDLSKGRIGEGNTNLLGSMLITKIYLSAMSRADVSPHVLAGLPNFYFYVDEFQSFANESFADILSEARKYKLNLTIAHQYIEQMPEEVRSAVFGNVGTMATFRVGAYDAEVLEKEYAPEFTAQDLVNLGFAQVYLKLMIDGIGSRPFSATTVLPPPTPDPNFKDRIIEASRRQFAHPRAEVEANIAKWFEPLPSAPRPAAAPSMGASAGSVPRAAHAASPPRAAASSPPAPASSPGVGAAIQSALANHKPAAPQSHARNESRPPRAHDSRPHDSHEGARREESHSPFKQALAAVLSGEAQEVSPAAAPAPVKKPDERASLAALANAKKNGSSGNGASKNRDALKDILAKAMNGKKSEPARPEKSEAKAERKHESEPKKEEKKRIETPRAEPSGPREIPESDLRKMLEVVMQKPR